MIFYTKICLAFCFSYVLVSCSGETFASKNWVQTVMRPEFSDLEKACLAGDRFKDANFGGSQSFEFEKLKFTFSTQLFVARFNGSKLSDIFPEYNQKDVGKKQCGMTAYVIQEDYSIPWAIVYTPSSNYNFSKTKIQIIILEYLPNV